MHREEHLSSVKWYGPEEKDKLLWTFNEKFVFIYVEYSFLIIECVSIGFVGAESTRVMYDTTFLVYTGKLSQHLTKPVAV